MFQIDTETKKKTCKPTTLLCLFLTVFTKLQEFSSLRNVSNDTEIKKKHANQQLSCDCF